MNTLITIIMFWQLILSQGSLRIIPQQMIGEMNLLFAYIHK